MRLISFCIENFRSIVNTGWVNFSSDNVTALVGQNESGKTAILEALSQTLAHGHPKIDDYRLGATAPVIRIATSYSDSELTEALASVKNEPARASIQNILRMEQDQPIIWNFSSAIDLSKPNTTTSIYDIEKPDIKSKLIENLVDAGMAAAIANVENNPGGPFGPTLPEGAMEQINATAAEAAKQFRNGLYFASSTVILFDEETGLLPNKIDITDEFVLDDEPGEQAVANFLTIAGIDLEVLVKSETRARAGILKAANRKISDDFRAFWSQTIGENVVLQLECSIHQHPFGHEKAGKSYLEFLITDATAPLYPKQRSRGTRWFISFFLQLRASSVDNEKLIFLLDEPGANLHEKAQADVLKLIEKIRSTIPVIYSTHSPHLMNEESFHRILAVERDPDQATHPTRVIGAHALGAASRDTLSPIFTMMGVSLSRQTAIRQHDNVILEEVSSHYYLKAFWILTGCTQEVHFLAATGTSNVPMYAQLFMGWGLDFIVVVDDEQSGRRVYNQLKRDLFLDDPAWAGSRMIKIPDCEGIEDIFEKNDYYSLVLDNTAKSTTLKNAEWAKKNGAAKAIHALKFLQKVEKKELQFTHLHADSQSRIQALVSSIAGKLEAYGRPS